MSVRPKCVCVRAVYSWKRTLMACARELYPTTAARIKGEFHLVWHHLSAVNNVFKQTKKKKKNSNNGPLFSNIIIIIIVLRCDHRRDLSIYLWTASAHYHIIIFMSFVYGRYFIPRTSLLFVCLLLLQSLPLKHTREGHWRFFSSSFFLENKLKDLYI